MTVSIDAYSRAVRRIRDHYDCCPDKLTKNQHRLAQPWIDRYEI